MANESKRLSEATDADFEDLAAKIAKIGGTCVQETARQFVDALFARFSKSIVLLRLFMTVRYDCLPEEDRHFVDRRGRDTCTSHLIHGATPIFTLIGTRGERPEWNDRRLSEHFRCIPLTSTAFVSSLSMLSRQFESVGFDLRNVDAWETEVTATGRADSFRGILHILDAGADRDAQGRMIVPKQDFVAACRIRTTLGFGSGYTGHPTLLTLFAFTSETFEPPVAEPVMPLLDRFRDVTEGSAAEGKIFSKTPSPS